MNAFIFRFVLTVFLALLVSSCSKKEAARKAAGVPVTVAGVESTLVPVQINTYGNVEAYTVVPVKSLVGGQILKAHVSSGQDVKAGDLLFSIDARLFEANLKQIEAKIEQLKEKRPQLLRVFGVSDVEIGNQILQKTETL